MAYESSAVVGSGLNPLKKDDCLLNPITGERHLRGTNVNVVNPEDASAGCSGLVTAVTLTGATVQIPTTPLKYRRSIALCNNSTSDTIYFGFDPSVTTGNGWPIPPGGSISLDINAHIPLWAVSGGSSTDVRVLELS